MITFVCWQIFVHVCCVVCCVAQEQLEAGDLVFVADGGRHGNDMTITGCFAKCSDGTSFEDKTKSTYFQCYDEQSLAARKEKNRGLLNQIEMVHVFSKGAMVLNKCAQKHYSGTSLGNNIGPIVVPKYDDPAVWRVTADVMRKIYGKTGKILVGGPCPVPVVAKPEFLDNCEPVTWHGSCPALYEELLHSFNVKSVCDATVADHTFALACLKAKIPYIGITMSESHAAFLQGHLVRCVWEEYQDEESVLYQPGLSNP